MNAIFFILNFDLRHILLRQNSENTYCTSRLDLLFLEIRLFNYSLLFAASGNFAR